MDMTVDQEMRILVTALEKYGAAAQRRQTIEEMAELTQAFCKLERVAALPDHGATLADARAHVLEELADVQIMINQMELLYGSFADWEEKKLHRLAARLGLEEGGGD